MVWTMEAGVEKKIGLWSNNQINYVRYITDSFQLLSVKIFRATMF